MIKQGLLQNLTRHEGVHAAFLCDLNGACHHLVPGAVGDGVIRKLCQGLGRVFRDFDLMENSVSEIQIEFQDRSLFLHRMGGYLTGAVCDPLVDARFVSTCVSLVASQMNTSQIAVKKPGSRGRSSRKATSLTGRIDLPDLESGASLAAPVQEEKAPPRPIETVPVTTRGSRIARRAAAVARGENEPIPAEFFSMLEEVVVRYAGPTAGRSLLKRSLKEITVAGSEMPCRMLPDLLMEISMKIPYRSRRKVFLSEATQLARSIVPNA